MVRSKLTAVMSLLFPYSWEVVDPITGEKSLRGATITPFLAVITSLNITLDLRLLKDISWGNRLPNGTYQGMQRLVYEGETDIAVGPYFESSVTSGEMEPGFPHYRSKIVFLTGCRSLFTTELSTAIFDLYVTLAIILCCLILPLILFLFQRTDDQDDTILDEFETIVSALLQEPADVTTLKSTPSRLVMISWGTGCFIIMQLLSGVLRSHTAVKTPVELIDSFTQVLRDPTIEVVAWAGTPTLYLLKERRGEQGQAFIDRVQKSNTFIENMTEIFAEHWVNKILDRKAIFVQEPGTIIAGGAPLCDKYKGFFHISEKENVESDLVWYYSPTLDIETRRAISLRTMWTFEAGIRWLKDWEMFPVAPKCFTSEMRKLKDPKVGDVENFTVEQVIPFFHLLFYGHTVSLGILIIECFRKFVIRLGLERQGMNVSITYVKGLPLSP